MKKPEFVYAVCGYHTYRPDEIHFFGFFLDEEKAQKEVDYMNYFIPPEAEFRYQLRAYGIGEVSKFSFNTGG